MNRRNLSSLEEEIIRNGNEFKSDKSFKSEDIIQTGDELNTIIHRENCR